MASILLADDDAAVRELVSRALIGEGHSVHVTQDGLEAFELFEARGQLSIWSCRMSRCLSSTAFHWSSKCWRKSRRWRSF